MSRRLSASEIALLDAQDESNPDFKGAKFALGTRLDSAMQAVEDSAASAAGAVIGPASSTDNAIVRFDSTTGELVQNSVVTIADSSGNIAGAGTIGCGAVTSTSFVEATGFSSAPVAFTSSAGACTANWALSGVLTHTLTENTTLSFSNARDGQVLTVVVTQHASAAKTFTFPTVLWAGGAAPTMSTGLSAVDVFTFYKVGAVYYGSFLQAMA